MVVAAVDDVDASAGVEGDTASLSFAGVDDAGSELVAFGDDGVVVGPNTAELVRPEVVDASESTGGELLALDCVDVVDRVEIGYSIASACPLANTVAN